MSASEEIEYILDRLVIAGLNDARDRAQGNGAELTNGRIPDLIAHAKFALDRLQDRCHA